MVCCPHFHLGDVLCAVCLSVLLSVHCIALYSIALHCNMFHVFFLIQFCSIDIFIGCHCLIFTIWVWDLVSCVLACSLLFTFLKYIISHSLDDFSSLCCVQCAVCVALLRIYSSSTLHFSYILCRKRTIVVFRVSFAPQEV